MSGNGRLQQVALDEFGGGVSDDVVYRDENGTAWYVNLADLLDIDNDMIRNLVGSWVDLDRDPWNRDKKVVDGSYVPIVGADAEQVAARKALLRDETIKTRQDGGRKIRVKRRQGELA